MWPTEPLAEYASDIHAALHSRVRIRRSHAAVELCGTAYIKRSTPEPSMIWILNRTQLCRAAQHEPGVKKWAAKPACIRWRGLSLISFNVFLSSWMLQQLLKYLKANYRYLDHEFSAATDFVTHIVTNESHTSIHSSRR